MNGRLLDGINGWVPAPHHVVARRGMLALLALCVLLPVMACNKSVLLTPRPERDESTNGEAGSAASSSSAPSVEKADAGVPEEADVIAGDGKILARDDSAARLVWMLPGIWGGPFTLHFARNAYYDAGVTGEIRIFDWERPGRPLANLTDYAGNRQKAAEIAGQIVDFRVAHPNARVDVVGYSGGGGLAVMVAEILPDDVHLQNLMLVQAAVSPEYDLTRVLSRVDGKLVNFYCPGDWLILGLGTQVYGTSDREHAASCGKEGFDLVRAAPDSRLRERIVQVRWQPEMILSGHWGNHFSILSYGWNREYVAPFLVEAGERGE